MHWYCHLIANYPLAVIATVLVITGTGIVISFTVNDLPDFSDPQLGFESRGTEISGRLKAWHNLLEETRPSGSLTTNPFEDQSQPPVKKKWKKSKKKFKDKDAGELSRLVRDLDDESAWGNMVTAPNNSSETSGESSKQVWRELLHYREFGSLIEAEEDESFFCDVPRMEYSHIIIKAKDPQENLLELGALQEICFLDKLLRHTPGFQNSCITPHASRRCCNSWHLPGFIAFIVGKSSCEELMERDVIKSREILCKCFSNSSQTDDSCSRGSSGCSVSACPNLMIADQIKNFLIDMESLETVKVDCGNLTVRYSGIYLPLAKSTSLTDYYENLKLPSLRTIDVVGYDFGIKSEMFNLYLKRDLMLLLIAAILVGVCMCFFFRSVVATAAVFVSIMMSVGMAYFVYAFVFKIRFFPFVNLLVLIIALGVGVDDAFIYFHHWKCAKSQLDGSPLAAVVSKALGSSASAMLVTSLTTSAACYASYASDVTALKVFGLFTGTAILFNYLLVISWLPAVIVLVEKCPKLFPRLTLPDLKCVHKLKSISCSSKVMNYSAYFCLISFLGLTAMSAVAVFYKPKFTLPDEKDFRLFGSSHPFENYYLFKERFLAGRSKEESLPMPLRFVFGIVPKDVGNPLEPSSAGRLLLDEQINVSSKESQTWLLSFCRKVKSQPFVDSNYGLFYKNCFIEALIAFMERPCLDPISGQDRSPCCESSKFPYPPSVFDLCLLESAKLPDLPNTGFLNAGPRFSKFSKNLTAFVIEYDSNYTYSSSFAEMNEFFSLVDAWFTNELLSAPVGVHFGFFVSYLEFYDLQLSLSTGTMTSVLISVSVSVILLLLCTRNFFVSISAALVTFSIVTSTFSVLIMIGWQLNVVESASISLAIGLSVDYTLHFSVIWCNEQSVSSTLRSVGIPVVIAAVTTVLPGIVMLFSSVLVYQKIGLFIITVTVISLAYSVLFLLPLLYVIGHFEIGKCFYYVSSCFRRRKEVSTSYLSVPTEGNVISLSSSSSCMQVLPVRPSSLELETLGNV